MIIENRKFIEDCRPAGKCEFCGKPCSKREGHHLWSKGLAGGTQLDLKCNLIALGSSKKFWICSCHSGIHNGTISRATVLSIVATREGVSPQDIEEVIFLFRRLPKNATDEQFEAELAALSPTAKELAQKEWLWAKTSSKTQKTQKNTDP